MCIRDRHYGYGPDEGRDIAVCADGGFFITGRSYAWATADYDWEIFLTKLDNMGNQQWVKHYGQLGEGCYDAGWSVCATPDSGCLIAGKTQSPLWAPYPYWDNMLLIKVDKNGDTVWTRSHGGYYFDRAWWIIPIPGTSEYFVSGCTHSYGPYAPDEEQSNIWVMRLDSLGEIICYNAWGNDLPGASDSRGCCLSNDGNGFVVVGVTDYKDTSYTEAETLVTRTIGEAVVLKYDYDCNLVWEKIYNRGYNHYSRGIVQAYGGGYIMVTRDQLDNRSWVLRLDENGDTLWTTYIGVDSTDNKYATYYIVTRAPNRGYYFSGGGDGKARILYTDEYLEKIWELECDYGDYSESFTWGSCKTTPDSGCVAAGETFSVLPIEYEDVFAVRCDRWGNDFTYYHYLSGRVYNAITRELIEGAIIYDTTHTCSTTTLAGDSVGYYYIDDVSSASEVFVAQKDGYNPDTATLDISDFVYHDFYLTPNIMVNLSGTILDSETSNPIEGAIIDVQTPTTSVADTSGSGGEYSLEIPGLMPATCIVSAEEYVSETLVVSLETDTIIDFVLERTTGVVDTSSLVVDEYSLKCSPNPFNSVCNIKIPIQDGYKQSSVKIQVFDLRGNFVKIIYEGKFSNREYVWNADENISSGIYIVNAIIGEHSFNRKVVLLK